MALFCGGLAQLLAGMWEFATGNTFGATGKFIPYTCVMLAWRLTSFIWFAQTAFTSYGAFWLSFAALLIPGSGIGDAYAASANPAQIVPAIAIYLITWGVVTFLFLYVYLHAKMIAHSRSNLFFPSLASPLSASRSA